MDDTYQRDTAISSIRNSGPNLKKAAVPPMKMRGLCDGLMGYGIQESFYICQHQQQQQDGGNAGELQCHFNPTTKATICEAHNLRVDPSKINVAAGGEPILHVQGRKENIEFPQYSKGAFQLSQCALADKALAPDKATGDIAKPKNIKLPYHLMDMMSSVQVVDTNNQQEQQSKKNQTCSWYEDRPTLFVTRYEYANLYHTMTDYYNSYQAAMIALKGNTTALERINVVFFDGHARGTLDIGWELLFPKADISYVSELQKHDGMACYRHAIFVSPGYRSSVSIVSFRDQSVSPVPTTYLPTCGQSEWQTFFQERMSENAKRRLSVFKGWLYPYDADDETEEHASSKRSITTPTTTTTVVKVLILLRKNHFSHPRMNGATSRQIENEDEIEAAIQNATIGMYSANNGPIIVDMRRLILEQHDLAEQIAMVHQADIIVGMHGAGLTHIFWARPGTLLLELKPPGYTGHGHFEPLTQMAGGLYRRFTSIHEAQKANPLVHRIRVSPFQEEFRASVDAFLLHHSGKNPRTTGIVERLLNRQ